MTITVTTVSNNQTFGAWLSTTNRLANLMSTNVVTADSTTTGSLTTGNVAVNGHFGATYLYAGSGLLGGNVGTNTHLLILSNTIFKDSASANQISITSNSSVSDITIRANTVNITPTNTTIGGALLTVSANVNITSNTTTIKTISLNDISTVTSFTNTYASTSAVSLDIFDKTTYRSAEYNIQTTYASGSVYQISKLHVIHDGTTAYSTEFGTISSNGTPISAITSSISGANVVLTITPTVAPVTVKVTRILTTV